ncbi:hypothetical protein [Halobacillus halophilus]|uniref:hypothetical protein n=1 Tax=Halobacillus halophilus TaxID=1570 RepID=UPI001CD3FDBC|nr:hypothetical protein [Halobacillus halophilus]MCA1009166.1 hypothetical protein [Halobacillus halophilus]
MSGLAKASFSLCFITFFFVSIAAILFHSSSWISYGITFVVIPVALAGIILAAQGFFKEKEKGNKIVHGLCFLLLSLLFLIPVVLMFGMNLSL